MGSKSRIQLALSADGIRLFEACSIKRHETVGVDCDPIKVEEDGIFNEEHKTEQSCRYED